MGKKLVVNIDGHTEEKLLYTIINTLKQFKKHKGSLFKAEWANKPSNAQQKGQKKLKIEKRYKIDPRIERIATIFLHSYPKENLKTDLLNYHPYISLWGNRKSYAAGQINKIFESSSFDQSALFTQEGCQETLADFNADYYWVKEQLNFAPFTAQVRAFEEPFNKQLAETKDYFKRFFRPDNVFTFATTNIPFKFESTHSQAQKLAMVSRYRTMLISYLKNNKIINPDCRYVWKVYIDLIDFKLKLHLFMIKRVPKGQFLESKEKEKYISFEHLIEKVATKLKIKLDDPKSSFDKIELEANSKQEPADITKQIQEAFNIRLNSYFKKAFWYPICRVKCANAKKMLFGKGNDKDEQ